MSGITKRTLSSFVCENSVLKSETETSLPTSIIDSREKRENSLKRPTHSWFAFCCFFEALFLVNLNAVQVLHHRGRVLQKITSVAARSDSLRQKFMECIPKDYEHKEILQIWRVYYLFIIPTFSALKSGDITRRIRESRPTSTTDQLATRAFAKVAVVKAKSKS